MCAGPASRTSMRYRPPHPSTSFSARSDSFRTRLTRSLEPEALSPKPLVVLGLVPARGGSKGVPGKNVRPLAGHTLLEYTARAARESGVVDRVILSTDSLEIADAGRRAGLEVPFMRPAALAADDTPMVPVIEHALGEIARHGWSPDIVVLLQPTSPLRRPEHIRDAVAKL